MTSIAQMAFTFLRMIIGSRAFILIQSGLWRSTGKSFWEVEKEIEWLDC